MAESTIDIRPPIVTIMGHIDHGKTTLLDKIRSSRVTAKEAGGITQHLGSYQIENKGQKITFIDTPGHEAFKSIRSRGIKTADVIIIVVAADEGVKPQTVEAIEIAKETKLPIMVAITKIDKENLMVDKIKADLAEMELISEEWGGETVMVEVSAVSGEGIDSLLEMIQLVSEVSEIKANYDDAQTDGFILESFLDSKMGPLSDVVVLNGKLKLGDILVAGTRTFGKIKRMESDTGELLQEAIPGQPVRLMGIKGVADAGDTFRVVESEKEAQAIIDEAKEPPKNDPVIQMMVEKEKELNIILKGDSIGSLDAIEYSLGQIAQIEMKINIVSREVGEVNASDIKQAKVHNAVILAFGLKQDKKMTVVAEQQDVAIKYYSIIYKLTDEIRDLLQKLSAPKITRNEHGNLRILKVFKEDKKSMILGGRVEDGKILRGSLVEIKNSEGKVIVQGKISQLQQEKEDTAEVLSGRECGMMIQTSFKKYTPEEGDVLYSYEQVKRQMS